MNRRCPESKLVGLGILREWKWLINGRGYANIVRSPGDVVYGLVYEISPRDEAGLDELEGVPTAYTKHIVGIELQSENDEGSVVQGLAYVDEIRTKEGEPRKEYVYRVNMGINDAASRGLPRWYIDKYMRAFIPTGEGE
jgi:gamma-glutamylcyclotransferase